MNFVARVLNSSKSTTIFLHKLFTKGPSLRVVTRWCKATFGSRSGMFKVTLLNCSINICKDSPFSCRMLTKANKVRWCGLLVANCVLKHVVDVSKQSIDLRGNRVNQFNVGPFKEVGNMRHITTSPDAYRPTYVVKMSTCSSGSMVPSYRSIVRPFHLGRSSTSNISFAKGCRPTLRVPPRVWLVTVFTSDSSLHVESASSLICRWRDIFTWREVSSNYLRILWLSFLKALISSAFLRINFSSCLCISWCIFSYISYSVAFWSVIFLVETIPSRYASKPWWAPNVLLWNWYALRGMTLSLSL